MTISGKYNSIIGFLNGLMTGGKVLDITGVEIRSEKEEDQDLKASFVLTLFVIERR